MWIHEGMDFVLDGFDFWKTEGKNVVLLTVPSNNSVPLYFTMFFNRERNREMKASGKKSRELNTLCSWCTCHRMLHLSTTGPIQLTQYPGVSSFNNSKKKILTVAWQGFQNILVKSSIETTLKYLTAHLSSGKRT